VFEHLRVALSGPLGPGIVDRMNAMLADTRFTVVPCAPAKHVNDGDDADRVDAVKRRLRGLAPEQRAAVAERLAVARGLIAAGDAARTARTVREERPTPSVH
jgi:hypothetical protein